MASSSNNNTATVSQPAASSVYGSDSSTTFVQADPSTFRHIVQKLTGASDDPSSPKLPVTHPARQYSSSTTITTPAAAFAGTNIGPKRPAFKLHERRQAPKKLEIKLNSNGGGYELCSGSYKQRGSSFLVSPVSTLEFLAASRVSPRSPRDGGGEEDRGVAEKGFYWHPSPLSTPRGGAEPELLPLFPLTSPRSNNDAS